jgi:hypothetical protein
MLAGIAAVACLSVLLVGSASSRLQGPADLLVRPPCFPLCLQGHPFAAFFPAHPRRQVLAQLTC